MSSIAPIASKFFEACETGKGWAICREWCMPEATLAAQAEPLADVRTLQQCTEWMKGLLTFIPDGRFRLQSFVTDDERNTVSAYAVFRGTHTEERSPCPPTGRTGTSDYVYVMYVESDKIAHMQKIWHAGLARTELGCV